MEALESLETIGEVVAEALGLAMVMVVVLTAESAKLAVDDSVVTVSEGAVVILVLSEEDDGAVAVVSVDTDTTELSAEETSVVWA